MQFGSRHLSECLGAILAHSINVNGTKLPKGLVLQAEQLAACRDSGITHLTVAVLESGDVEENSAASVIAAHVAGSGLQCSVAERGRVNLFATRTGVLQYDAATLATLNAVDEGITIALHPCGHMVAAGQLTGTIKIIPFSITVRARNRFLDQAGAQACVTVTEFVGGQVTLIFTTIPGVTLAKHLDKAEKVLVNRVTQLGYTTAMVEHIAHETAALANALARTAAMDLVLIAGASAITDRRDVIPSAIIAAGGEIYHFGMPVDPGNLMLAGALANTPVLGLPGCAKSPAFNGVDLVLRRLAVGKQITPEFITSLGAGGLLKEIHQRPVPRITPQPAPAPNKPVGIILLAAGSARRFGGANKLLADWHGVPLIRASIGNIPARAEFTPRIAVAGRDAPEVSRHLQPWKFVCLHNLEAESGMSSSIRLGLAQLPDTVAGAFFVLADMPKIAARTYDDLFAAFNKYPDKSVFVPIFAEQMGNPVLIRRNFFSLLLDLEGDGGAKGLFAAYPDVIIRIPVDDAGILFDVDHPSDINKLD